MIDCIDVKGVITPVYNKSATTARDMRTKDVENEKDKRSTDPFSYSNGQTKS